jgi:hypothetical protein
MCAYKQGQERSKWKELKRSKITIQANLSFVNQTLHEILNNALNKGFQISSNFHHPFLKNLISIHCILGFFIFFKIFKYFNISNFPSLLTIHYLALFKTFAINNSSIFLSYFNFFEFFYILN